MIEKGWKGLAVFAGECWKFIKESWALCLLGILIVVLGGVLLAVMFSSDCAVNSDCAVKQLGGLLGTLGSDVAESGKERTIRLIGWGIGGLLVATGAVVLNKRANAQVRNNELVEKGHSQERFKAATEHLGNENAMARIASFYEFLHLAKDNAEYRESIFNILCAYLRQTTTAPKYVDENEKPSEEVQSLLDILFKSNKNIFGGLSINLQGVHLRRANLQEANLQEANLQFANLQEANLQEANLQEANLQEANLQEANLQEANLQEANLQEANLQEAYLQFANLQEAYLQFANLQFANLQIANLQGANLLKVVLREANLQEANLQEADLQGADLRFAYLQEAYLQGADLQGADLRGANLQFVDLREVKLENTLFGDAKYNDYTKFPDGFNPSDEKMVPESFPDDSKAQDEN